MSDDFAHLDATLEATDGRTWGHVPYVKPVHPDPQQRSVDVDPSAACVPRNVRTLAKGRSVRITHAVGHDFHNATGGVAVEKIMEPTGETTPTGKPAMKQVGKRELPPVNSILMVIKAGGFTYVGHWLNDGFDFGMILRGRTVIQNVNYTQLKGHLDAQGSKNVRQEELPL